MGETSLIKALVDFFVSMIPQKDDDAMALYRWRWKSIALGVAAMALGAYGASLIPGIKPDYAPSADVTELRVKINAVDGKLDGVNSKISQINAQLKESQARSANNDLIDARRYQCRAINSDDRTALPFWTNRLQELKITYFTLTGTQWPELDCKSF